MSLEKSDSCTICVHIIAHLVCLYSVTNKQKTAGSLAWSQFFSSWGPSWQTWQPRRSSSPQIPLHQSHIHYSSLWLSEYERAEHQCLVFDYLLLPQSLDRMELETKFLAAKQTQLHALTNWRSGVWEPSYVRPKSSHFLTDWDLFQPYPGLQTYHGWAQVRLTLHYFHKTDGGGHLQNTVHIYSIGSL